MTTRPPDQMHVPATVLSADALQALWHDIVVWAHELGFDRAGVADVDLSHAEQPLLDWLAAGFHGTMSYMQRHGVKRARPAELVPGTVRVLSFSLNYLPEDAGRDWIDQSWRGLEQAAQPVISWYARGRDYHKVSRARLEQLAQRIGEAVGPRGYRVFTDSAPVMEVELAQRAGIGWRGKHTLAIGRDAGSMFFLGEIFIDLALPLTPSASAHCGICERCMTVCPTQAIIAPYKLDARRCISYLTIEHAGPIPIEFREPMGNRIYGCDDCQLVCPWNKFAKRSPLEDFKSRVLEGNTLIELFNWSEAEFLRHTEGSPIRRIGHLRWLRNLAIALGNALALANSDEAAALTVALSAQRDHPDAVVKESVVWALGRRVCEGREAPLN